MYAVIYVFYRSIRTVLQNVMTASVVMCTSLFRMCAPEMLCSGCALFRRCALLRCAAQSCAVQGALLRMCAGCSISAPLCLCPAVTSQCMHNSLRTFDRVSHNAAAGEEPVSGCGNSHSCLSASRGNWMHHVDHWAKDEPFGVTVVRRYMYPSVWHGWCQLSCGCCTLVSIMSCVRWMPSTTSLVFNLFPIGVMAQVAQVSVCPQEPARIIRHSSHQTLPLLRLFPL